MKLNSMVMILKTFVGGLTLTSVLASGPVARMQSETSGALRGQKGCSNATLFGDYGTKLEGTILGSNLTLRTLVLAHFDGKGNLTSRDHVVLNGTPPEEEWRETTGSYTVNADCTGSATVDVQPGRPPLKYYFIVIKNGQEILEVVDGNAVSGVAYKLDREQRRND